VPPRVAIKKPKNHVHELVKTLWPFSQLLPVPIPSLQKPKGLKIVIEPIMTSVKNAVNIGFASAAGAIAAALTWRALSQRRIRKQTTIDTPHGIDETLSVSVQGTELIALVRGANRSNPVLLMVHGGPGTPDSSVARAYDYDLVDDFVVVRYDQRGTGRSSLGRVPINKHSVELYVDDLLHVATELRERFRNQHLILLGNSWGSVIGMLGAQRRPDLFDAYVGVSQVVDLATSDPWSYDDAMAAANAQGKHKLVRKLNRIDRDSYYVDYDQVRAQRNVLFKTGGVMVRRSTKREMLMAMLRSPDYGLVDLWRTARNATKLGRRLYPQMALTNLFDLVDELRMPVYFIEGRQDRQVSPQLAHDYLQRLRAPLKKLMWVEDAGHFFDFEKPNDFHACMRAVKSELKHHAMVKRESHIM
jgi:pimeloyl-ACP methyl ester carboxylesterase